MRNRGGAILNGRQWLAHQATAQKLTIRLGIRLMID
jgi:hypothetical protein